MNEIIKDKNYQLDTKSESIVSDIIDTDNTDDLKALTNMFNINMAKKNMLRLLKLNGLLDSLSDVAVERLQNNPDEITNKELMEYLNVVQNLIDKSTKTVDTVNTAPVIQINTQNNVLVTSDGESLNLSKESRDKVLDVVAQLREMIETKGDTN